MTRVHIMDSISPRALTVLSTTVDPAADSSSCCSCCRGLGCQALELSGSLAARSRMMDGQRIEALYWRAWKTASTAPPAWGGSGAISTLVSPVGLPRQARGRSSGSLPLEDMRYLALQCWS